MNEEAEIQPHDHREKFPINKLVAHDYREKLTMVAAFAGQKQTIRYT